MVNLNGREGEAKESTSTATSTAESMPGREMEELGDGDQTNKSDGGDDGAVADNQDSEESTNAPEVPSPAGKSKHLKSKPASAGNSKPESPSLTTSGPISSAEPTGMTDQNQSLPLEIGEKCLVQRNDNQWRKLRTANGQSTVSDFTRTSSLLTCLCKISIE